MECDQIATQREVRSHCPITFSLEAVGDRWTLIVLRDLIIGGKRHFARLQEADEGIASNILASRLKDLEIGGLVSRRPDPGNARQIIYEPTSKGLDLIPVLFELIRWGAKHDSKTTVPKQLLVRINRDSAGFEREIRAAYMPSAKRNSRAEAI